MDSDPPLSRASRRDFIIAFLIPGTSRPNPSGSENTITQRFVPYAFL